MITLIKRFFVLSVLISFICCLSAGVAWGSFEVERTDGGHFSLVDESGHVLTKTALPVYQDDEFIAPDNRRFKVARIEGDICQCTLVGQEKMPQVEQNPPQASGILGLTPVIARSRGTIGIYSTHSDESYVPSDGTDSINGRGGIYQVGQSLRNRLSSLGVNAILDKTTHNPHDVNAYSRSRRTASKLLRQGAVGLIDVHRDAVPEDVYATKVQGKNVTKVKLVVGRQNPHMSSNLEFAKRIKAHLDQKHPGLAAGIFIGKGNYNQDLSPRAILVEVGAHTNNKKQAEQGVELFADAVPNVFGVEKNGKTPLVNVTKTGTQGSDWTAIIWIIAGVAVIYGAYIAINRRKV